MPQPMSPGTFLRLFCAPVSLFFVVSCAAVYGPGPSSRYLGDGQSLDTAPVNRYGEPPPGPLDAPSSGIPQVQPPSSTPPPPLETSNPEETPLSAPAPTPPQPSAPEPPPPATPKPPPPPAPSSSPAYGKPVPGRQGFVYPPGVEPKPENMVDVRDFTPGQKVRDPRTGKIFLVP